MRQDYLGKSLNEIIEQIKDQLRLGRISEDQANAATRILYLNEELLSYICEKTKAAGNSQFQVDVLISLIQTLLAHVLESQLESEGAISNMIISHTEEVLNSPLSAFSLKCIVKLDSRH